MRDSEDSLLLQLCALACNKSWREPVRWFLRALKLRASSRQSSLDKQQCRPEYPFYPACGLGEVCVSLLATSVVTHHYKTVPTPSNAPCTAFRPFTSSPSTQASSAKASIAARKRRHQDPYALAQARARKAANLSRQAVLKKERAVALGDPIRGIETPFIRSFDHTHHLEPRVDYRTISKTTTAKDAATPPPSPDPDDLVGEPKQFKHFLTEQEIETQLRQSRMLAVPSTAHLQPEEDTADLDQLAQQHATATTAINRIVSLANGNSQDRTRVNIQRCIATFGRHNTDKVLPPKATAVVAPSTSGVPAPAANSNTPQRRQRAGPDTGSSEVQIAVLTAKIRALADFLETRGRTDKVNKRNLTLLVHRRQKLLQYLRRRERGGPRWAHLVETLGLTEGTWKGEISLR